MFEGESNRVNSLSEAARMSMEACRQYFDDELPKICPRIMACFSEVKSFGKPPKGVFEGCWAVSFLEMRT